MTNKKRQSRKRVKTENWKKNHFHFGLKICRCRQGLNKKQVTTVLKIIFFISSARFFRGTMGRHLLHVLQQNTRKQKRHTKSVSSTLCKMMSNKERAIIQK